jgi:hypothetical protein
MKKYVFTALVIFVTTAAFAQQQPTNPPATDTTAKKKKVVQPAPAPTPTDKKGKKDWSKVVMNPKRPQDHFMVELGYDNWVGATDSMNIKGFNHSENFYFMYSWPVKSDARLSLAAGVGLGSSNIYFAHQEVLVAAANQTLAFPDEEGGPHFKKYKLTTTYLEFPFELRFALDPENYDHTWKFAVGVKVGLMLSAYTKGKDQISAQGSPVPQGNYTEKLSSKQFFSGAEITPTIRVSKGFIGFFAQIHANPLIKASAGPAIFPISGGIVLSGL